jgi:hypothetical protein
VASVGEQSGSPITARGVRESGHRVGPDDGARYVVGVVLEAVERYWADVAIAVGPVVGPRSVPGRARNKKCLVELVRRYSNRPDLQERLAEARSRASQRHGQEPDSQVVTLGARAPRTWRVRDRLTDADVQALIGEFLSGTPKRVLAEHYAISIGTVKNILRKHGVRRPN